MQNFAKKICHFMVSLIFVGVLQSSYANNLNHFVFQNYSKATKKCLDLQGQLVVINLKNPRLFGTQKVHGCDFFIDIPGNMHPGFLRAYFAVANDSISKGLLNLHNYAVKILRSGLRFKITGLNDFVLRNVSNSESPLLFSVY